MFLVTLFFSLLIVCAVVLLLANLKTPHYRVSEKEYIRLLTLVVSGQATENDWQVGMAMPVRNNPVLEEIRERCLAIAEDTELASPRRGFLFNESGIQAFSRILDELTAVQRHQHSQD